MTETPTSPSAAELFQRWKQFFEAGTPTTASLVAADHPILVPEVQRLIDSYLAHHQPAAGSTVTGGDPTAGPPAAPAIPGFTVESFLGGGGMGEVWRVRDPLDQVHALKLVRTDRLSAAGRERFLAEARAMNQVRHPHVVHVPHFGIHGDLPYYLMRPYPASLKDRLADYQADPKPAVRLMAAVADGVGSLHGRGFVHRDLKPGNVLLDETGTPAVSDFGLVKSLTDDTSAGDPGGPAGGSAETFPTGPGRSRTLVGAVLGTRAYMSPEQAAGRTDRANPRWDVWALGVMLHELLTGRLPPSSYAPEHLLDPSTPDNPPPSSFRPGLDPRLERIVRRCLARTEADRYPDGAAVAADLRGWLNRGGRRWRRVAAAAAGLVVVVAAAIGIARFREPADPVVDDRVQFPDGQTVEVVPAAGLPAWYDLAVGQGLVQPHRADDDGALVIDSGRMVLMDLPPTGLDRYRFEVQARQASREPDRRFGLYAGRVRLKSGGDDVDCFLTLWFNDRVAGPGQAPRGVWTLAARPHRPVAGAGGATGGVEFDSGEYDPPPPGTYHTLAVEVRPDGMTFFLDGRRCGVIPLPLPANSARFLAESAGLPPGSTVEFSPSGGYGLLAFGGTCAFRNGTVRRLPDP